MFFLLAFIAMQSVTTILISLHIFKGNIGNQRLALVLAAIPTVFLSLWVAQTWVLSLLSALNLLGILTLSTALLVVVVGYSIYFNKNSIDFNKLKRLITANSIKCYIPIIFLFAGLLWKGFVLPTCNTDALYVHLPRAVWIRSIQGFPLFNPSQAEWGGHGSFPLNYEGLLANAIALTQNDHVTEWFSTLCLVFLILLIFAFILIFSTTYSHKSIASLLFLYLSIPVITLHGASDKVDMAVAVVFASTLFWLYWWITQDQRDAVFLLAWSAACLGIGFKKTGLILIMLVIVVAVATHVLSMKYPRLPKCSPVTLLILIPLTGMLLGIGGYIYNFYWFGNLFGFQGPLGIGESSFFNFKQLFQYPLLLNFVPFSSRPDAVWVPWMSAYWYWPAANMFFSHWGIIFNLCCLVASPISMVWAYKLWGKKEKYLLPLAAFGVFLIIVTKGYGYEGGVNSFPRFTLFFSVFLAVFVLWPLVAWIDARSDRCGTWVYQLSLVFLVFSTSHYLSKDLYAPLDYLVRLSLDPSLRRTIASNPNRTPSVVDRLAGPREVIATDLTYHTWLHPLYGADLNRPVRVLSFSNGKFAIPPDAKWVVADNVSNMIWNPQIWNPGKVTNGGDLLSLMGKGVPTDRDTTLYRQLILNPDFELIAADPKGAQCIFRRKA